MPLFWRYKARGDKISTLVNNSSLEIEDWIKWFNSQEGTNFLNKGGQEETFQDFITAVDEILYKKK